MKSESNGSINPLFKNLVQRDNLETPVPRIPIQAKLTVGAPGDKYEQEADQVAHNVVQQINSPTPDAIQANSTVQRETVEEDDTLQTKSIIQRQELDGGVEASSELESSINQAKGGGQSLDTGLQRSMGQAMGADFSRVKVHTDSTADNLSQSIQAKAFTTGDHVFFKKGEYQPGNEKGQELIAHELTHVEQQNGSQVQRAIDQSLIDEFSRVLEIQNPRVIEVPNETINNETTLYDTRFSEYGNDNLLNVDDLKSESLASVNLPDVIESYRKDNDPYLSQPVVDILDGPGGAAYLHTKHVAVYNRGLINAKKDGNVNRTILHEMGHGKQDSQGANFGTSHRIILEYHNVLLNENLYPNTSVGQQENATVRMEYMKTKSKIASSGKTWNDLLENATAEANPKKFQNEKLLFDIACIVGTDDRLEQGADKVIENLINEYFHAVDKNNEK